MNLVLNLTRVIFSFVSPSPLGKVGVGLLLVFTSVVFPQTAIKQIQSKIDKFYNDKFFESSLAAVDVYNLTQKKSTLSEK